MDEISAAQIEALHAQLLELVEQLQATLDSTRDAARPVELDQTTMGRVSRIDAIQQQKMIEASRRNQTVRLRQARAALARIADDEYGDCLKCDEPIGTARLTARPESPFCVACQGRAEKTR